MERRLKPFWIKTFIPTALMVVCSWGSFLIPPDSFPGRTGMLVGLLLVLINIKLRNVDQSPAVKSCDAVTLWCMLCISMVVLALVEYAAIIFAMRFGKHSSSSKTVMKKDDQLR